MRGAAILAAAALFAAAAGAGEPGGLYYVVEGERLVFTNSADQAGARPVPGLATPQRSRPGPSARVGLPETIYDPFIDEVAREFGLSPRLIKAVAVVESGFDPHAVSRAGAQGLMQLMPATARQYGVRDAFDPLQNLRAGARHLRAQLDEFDGNLSLALAAYNAGAGTVRRHGGIPNYPETRRYVQQVRERLGPGTPSGRATSHPAPPSRRVRVVRAEDGTVALVN